MNVEHVMSAPAHVLRPDATAREAARLMEEESVGCVFVARDERPEGVVTDRDLALRVAGESRYSDDTRLEHIMSPCPALVFRGRDLRYATELMRKERVRRLAVVDAGRRIVGVISLDDVIRSVAEDLGAIAAIIEAEVGR